MSSNCPICKSPSIDNGNQPPKIGDREYFNCSRCGEFILSRSILQGIVEHHLLNDDLEKIAVLSHSIRKMQGKGDVPYLDSYLVEQLLLNHLPNLSEQINNLILWLGKETDPGQTTRIDASIHQSVMGAKTPSGFSFIVKHLISRGLIEDAPDMGVNDSIIIDTNLTFEGWRFFDQINRGALTSKKAFMAMKYGDPDLNSMFNQYFKPAVAATGFELYKLDELPKAGLIDDRLRVEIRSSRFLISDLTHENAGAYWEAGFAEGLGKPVIYTCEKKKFESQKTHFDTNHHLTVIWDMDNPKIAIERLKATIRATLPDEAKLTDG